MTTITIADVQQMHKLGESVAKQMRNGDIVVLSGPLGAGKTTFAQGIGRGLGIKDAITSPTFVVARQHRAGTSGLGLTHVDAYRLRTADDLVDLDIDSQSAHVTLIEWGADFVGHICDSWLTVEISRDSIGTDDAPEAGTRVVQLTGHGPDWFGRELEVGL
jgi:tRNA threonylcarbamoyladenosine biosynthesis protein TsaE